MLWPTVFHHMALAPPLGLAVSRHRRDAARWLVAGAILVSWLVDWIGVVDHAAAWGATALVPVLQCGLIYVLLYRPQHALLVMALVWLLTTVMVAVGGLDMPWVATVVSGAAIVARLPRRGWLRWGLIVYFGLGSMAFLALGTVWGYWLYQSLRAVGIALLTLAMVSRQQVRMA